MHKRQPSLFSAFAALLISAAIVLRVAVPAGWMPDSDADGMMRITLCTGYGKVSAWVDGNGTIHRGNPAEVARSDDGSDDSGDDGSDGGRHCAFTAAAMSLALADIAELPQLVLAPRDMPQPMLRDLAPGKGLAAPPPPATGPPSFV